MLRSIRLYMIVEKLLNSFAFKRLNRQNENTENILAQVFQLFQNDLKFGLKINKYNMKEGFQNIYSMENSQSDQTLDDENNSQNKRVY